MNWMGLLIIAVVLATEALFVWACAMLAKTKGYSPVLWGILAFLFFGMLIVIVLLMLPTRTRPEGGGSI